METSPMENSSKWILAQWNHTRLNKNLPKYNSIQMETRLNKKFAKMQTLSKWKLRLNETSLHEHVVILMESQSNGNFLK